MKRYISIWLPHWSTDRWRRFHDHDRDSPLVLIASAAGGQSITAVDSRAQAEGLHPGQRLADARAVVPQLHAADADPLADAQALGRLADWCGRYTPWSSTDGDDAITLDITGCAHLFGGEAALIADLVHRLSRFGVGARAASADTPAAAWAWARYGAHLEQEGPILAAGQSRERLAALPVQALRLPTEAVENLRRLGLRGIGDVMDLPRAPLAARLGREILIRLDRAFGVEAEAISPRRPPALWRARLAFVDSISQREDLDRGTRHLLDELCCALEADGRGARRLELAFYRVDGSVQIVEIGTSQPTRDATHLARLFAEKLGTIAPGFGIETMILGAVATDRLAPRQIDLATHATSSMEGLAPIIDRLQNRLGRNAVVRLVPVDSHIPERAVVVAPAVSRGRTDPSPERPRPIQLLAAPEPIEVIGLTDAPPSSFRWRHSEHRIVQVEGPERVAPEWWRKGDPATRDYYWLQDSTGRRYWVYRDLKRAAWFLHGLFA
jgi:protein ImuB